jgi:mono/diheme cytochrome c family protein
MTRIQVSMILAATALLSCGGAQAADVSAGRSVALNVCSACHQVAPDQEFPPFMDPPATPFRTIAQRPDFSARWLSAYIASRHPMSPPGEMPNPMLTSEQVGEVAGYILSLRNQR